MYDESNSLRKNYTMNTYKFMFCTTWACLLAACGSNSEKLSETSTSENYKLEIVDSVQVDILTNGASVVDVHPETGEILLIQADPPKLWILSPEGEINQVWEKSGNGPDEIGEYLLSAEFIGGHVALMGYLQLKIFDRDFSLVKSHKPSFENHGMIYMGFNHLFAFEQNGRKQLVTFFGGPQTDHHWDSDEYYEEFNVVDVIDPYPEYSLNLESESAIASFEPVGAFTEDSQFKKSGRSYMFTKPVFDVKGETLHYAFQHDTVLFKRSLPKGELISAEPLPFDEFYLNNGWTRGKAVEEMNSGNVAPRDEAGSVDRVFHSNGFDVVIYRSGLPLERVQQIELEGTEKFYEILRLNYTKYLILENGERKNLELRYPTKAMSPMNTDEQGFIYANQRISQLEEEPDLLTIYKLKIVPDEE